jgi:hypothetical protein
MIDDSIDTVRKAVSVSALTFVDGRQIEQQCIGRSCLQFSIAKDGAQVLLGNPERRYAIAGWLNCKIIYIQTRSQFSHNHGSIGRNIDFVCVTVQ